MEKYVIGVDIGTTYAKAILFDSKGHEVVVEKGKIAHYADKPLHMEMDMTEVYEEVSYLIKRLVENNNVTKEQILALGIGGQSEGLWPVGYDGEPCGRAIMWCDARATEISQQIMSSPERMMKIFDISGGIVTGASGSSISRWLKEHEPERYEKIQWIGTCFDWIKFKMTGEMTMSNTYTADLLDIRTLKYSDELIELYDVEHLRPKLPPLRAMSKNHAPLSKEAAEKMNLCEGIPVVGGPFDMVACSLGVGASEPGVVAVIMGTSNMIAYPVEDPEGVPTEEGNAIKRPHACDNMWMQLTGTMTCTPNFDWAIEQFGKACGVEKGEYSKLEEVMERVPIGCDGLIYHPYISPTGERAPFANPYARAQFTGISLDHTSAHMLRAVYEGVIYSIWDCMCVLRQYDIKELRVAGGGGRSPFIMQMLADITGVKTVRMKGNEEGARGSALIAGVAAGKFENMRVAANKILEVEREFHPNPENTRKYQEIYKLYKKIRLNSEEFWTYRDEIMRNVKN